MADPTGVPLGVNCGPMPAVDLSTVLVRALSGIKGGGGKGKN